MSTMLEPSTPSADVYAYRIARTLNNGFIALMISVGHRTGLFDVMASVPPSTSGEIAAAAGLAERYVREWLAAMTSAHIIDHDARTSTYYLHIEYAAVLSRGAGSDNLAPAAQILALVASVEDQVVEGFRSGGGISAQAYDRLSEIVSAEKRRLVDESYVETLLEFIPGMHARLTRGATVLDAGCGDGAVLNVMARMFPRSTFRGFDLSPKAIMRAREAAAEADLDNVELKQADVATLDEQRAYDLVLALESVHELSFPRIALRRFVAALKTDGIFLMQEIAASSHVSRNIDHPFAPMLYALSTLHSLPIALGQEGEALGRMWGKERAIQLLGEAGFRNLRFDAMAGDALSYYCVAMK
jgi:2-polyprenyl-3-methyl-5-hydroxy-6-metoxy-1,4-benzoquinol methylase